MDIYQSSREFLQGKSFPPKGSLFLLFLIVLFSCSDEKGPEAQKKKNIVLKNVPVKQISTGDSYSCVVINTGVVKCWGDGSHGKLGNGTKVNQSIPKNVIEEEKGENSLKNILQVSAGSNSTCVLDNEGSVKCWGKVEWGQLGNGETGSKNTYSYPINVKQDKSNDDPLKNIVQISSGFNYHCALSTTGTVKCWGKLEWIQSDSADISSMIHPYPMEIMDGKDSKTPLSGVVQLATGKAHACALMKNEQVKCWGKLGTGQLGNGETSHTKSYPYPVTVVSGKNTSNPLTEVIQIASGNLTSCALIKDGSVKCWGSGINGQLGNDNAGVNYASAYPAHVVKEHGSNTPLTNVTQTTVGDHHACAIHSNGQVKCWGKGENGRLGNKGLIDKDHPVGVIDVVNTSGTEETLRLNAIVRVSAGTNHTCAINTDGNVKCWGKSSQNELGNGDAADQDYPQDYPVNVLALALESGYSKLFVGKHHTEYLCYSDGTCRFNLASIPTPILHSPSGTPWNETSPIFRIYRVKNGDTVSLHPDISCNRQSVASGTAEGSEVDLTVHNVAKGKHTFYTMVDGSCSLLSVSYTYNSNIPRLTLLTSSPSNERKPTLKARLVSSGDNVKLYLDDNCEEVNLISDTVLAGNGAFVNITAKSLVNEGTNTFYLHHTNLDGSTCYSESVEYVLDLTAPAMVIPKHDFNVPTTGGKSRTISLNDYFQKNTVRDEETYNITINDRTPCVHTEEAFHANVSINGSEIELTFNIRDDVPASCKNTRLNIAGLLSDNAGNSSKWTMATQLSD